MLLDSSLLFIFAHKNIGYLHGKDGEIGGLNMKVSKTGA